MLEPYQTFPPRRRFSLVLLSLAALVAVGVAIAGYQVLVPTGPRQEIEFTIGSGETVKQVSTNLFTAKLIRSRFWFEAWVWVTKTQSNFVAGEYHAPSPLSVAQLVRFLTGGVAPANELTVRFIEGWTAQQMGGYLEAQGVASASTFTKLTRSQSSFSSLFTKAGLTSLQPGFVPTTLEGYLFPDTYRLFRPVQVDELVLKMLLNFKQKFSVDWVAELARHKRTPYQALTMASIVEREVPGGADRAKVADIFWRRLAVGQGLEADSTINYITGKSTASVSSRDLSLDSPYNTYRYRGLPPGPISNPGESALKAAVYPSANPYWYFLTTPEGKVIYSKTYAEHLKAKQQYLR